MKRRWEMTRKRRRTSVRDTVLRTRMWDKKMDPEVISRYIEISKEIALPRVEEYQAIHENLINIVKNILKNYPDEYVITQEYMWFAEKLWRLTKHYTGLSLQREAEALFIYYLVRGRSEEVLRKISKALGITLRDTSEILSEIGVIVKPRILAQGVFETSFEEKTLVEMSEQATLYGFIDLSEMKNEDEILVRYYIRLLEGTEFKLYALERYTGIQDVPVIRFPPIFSTYGIKITIEQLKGEAFKIPYLFIYVPYMEG